MPSFHKFIKYIPKCTDCKHLLLTDSKNVFANTRCKKNIYNSLDNVHLKKYENAYIHEYEYTYIARSIDNLCGLDGKKFEPKKK